MARLGSGSVSRRTPGLQINSIVTYVDWKTMSKSRAPTTISLGDLTLVLAEENALLSLDSTESPPWLMAGSCDTSYV